MKLFNFSPLTQKRLQRFHRSTVARYSLILLIVVYIISLCAELICNAKPLVMRFNGELYFPFLHARPPAEILAASESLVHVDYRQFVKSETFKKDEKNFALFPILPYSPHEALDTAELEANKEVTLTLLPQQPVGRFNLTPAMKVIRQEGCEQFFPGVDLIDERAALGDLIEIPFELQVALTRRMVGELCPEEVFEVTPKQGLSVSWKTLNVTLCEQVAGVNPNTLRVNVAHPMLKEKGGSLQKLTLKYAYTTAEDDETLEIVQLPVDPIEWEGVSPEQFDTIKGDFMALAVRAFKRDIVAADKIAWVSPAGVRFDVTSVNNLRFPFHPTWEHPFGLDGSGRDVCARILYATRIAMSFGLVLAFTATLIGLIVGAMQGYFGGKLDICVQRFTEIWAALPFLYIMILVGSVFGKSFSLLLLCYGLFCWLGMSYYMRAEFLRLRGRPFVDAARCQGLGHARIIFRHILPNALTPIITLFPFLLVGAIGALVSLDFLGFGLPPLTPSWGELLSQAQAYRWAWWLILFPSAAIFVVMFLTVMVGEGVRNAFDPKPFSRLQ